MIFLGVLKLPKNINTPEATPPVNNHEITASPSPTYVATFGENTKVTLASEIPPSLEATHV